MTLRTRTETVTFTKPFRLGGFDGELPAGAYLVETDEELMRDISFPVYRRVTTVIHLQESPDRPGRRQTLTIDPQALEAALEHDQALAASPALAAAEAPADRAAHPQPRSGAEQMTGST
jgi:hypothetical protein